MYLQIITADVSKETVKIAGTLVLQTSCSSSYPIIKYWRCQISYYVNISSRLIEIARVMCRFILEPTAECSRDICNMFSVSPQQGTLSPTDRPATVQITFQSNCEVTIKDQPILRCHVVEPTIGDSGEMIASIPIKVSVRSTYTKSVSASVFIMSKQRQLINILHGDDDFEEMF